MEITPNEEIIIIIIILSQINQESGEVDTVHSEVDTKGEIQSQLNKLGSPGYVIHSVYRSYSKRYGCNEHHQVMSKSHTKERRLETALFQN